MGVGVWQLLPPTAEQSFLYKQMNIKRVRLKKAVLHPILTHMRLSSSIFLGKGHNSPFPHYLSTILSYGGKTTGR